MPPYVTRPPIRTRDFSAKYGSNSLGSSLFNRSLGVLGR